MISKYCTAANTKRWIDNIDDHVATLNSRYHSGIDMTPNDADKPENQLAVLNFLERKRQALPVKKPNYLPGEIVRISKDSGKFNRSYNKQSVEECFVIVRQVSGFRQPLYELQSLSPPYDNIVGVFAEFELTPVSRMTEFKIDRVLRRKNGLKEVTFRFLPPRFTLWVAANATGPFYPLAVSAEL